MTFFGIYQGQPFAALLLPIIFTLLSLRYVWNGIQLGQILNKEWTEYIAAPLNRRKKQLSEQAAFFIMVPISVAIHEFGHALATWIFEGRIVDFGYAFFWGYVVPVGEFSFSQYWFIALAGTLGSLFFGLAFWLLTRDNPSTAIKYLGLRTFRYQIYFSLIYYPAFTALTSFGDWRTIYDFSLTPFESGLTAVFHVLVLGGSYLLDRRGWFDLPALDERSEKTYEAIDKGEIDLVNSPEETLATIEALLVGDSPDLAKRLLSQFEAAHPSEGRVPLLKARIDMAGQHQASNAARLLAERALEMGLSRPVDIAEANYIVATYYEERKPEAALGYYDKAIGLLERSNPGHLRYLYIFHYYRQRLNRQLTHYDVAYQDLSYFLQVGERLKIEGTREQYDQELKVLQHHSGRTFGEAVSKEL